MIDERGAKHIANLTNLKKLSFRINSTIYLGNNHIGDDGVRFLKKLPNLTWLNLCNNSLQTQGITTSAMNRQNPSQL